MDMQVRKQGTRRGERRINAQHGAGFGHMRQAGNASTELDLTLASGRGDIELEHRPTRCRKFIGLRRRASLSGVPRRELEAFAQAEAYVAPAIENPDANRHAVARPGEA